MLYGIVVVAIVYDLNQIACDIECIGPHRFNS